MQWRARGVLLCCLLLLLGNVSWGQSGECEESELGYACKKQMTDYYALHWSLGPTTAGAEAAEGEIAIAMVGETEGWVGFAFAETPGSMAPADFVIGWVDGTDVVVLPYRSEIQFITAADEDDQVTLSSVEGSEEGGFTTIRFVRSLTDGTTNIAADDEIPVNVAIGSDDVLETHSQRMPTTVTLNLASDSSGSGGAGGPAVGPATPAPEAALESEIPPMEAVEPTAEAPAPEQAASTGGEPRSPRDAMMTGACTPSTLGYTCMQQQGAVTMHWTVGPSTAANEIPEVANGEIAMAISAMTDGWVGISFAENPGVMEPADAVIGWVSGGTANVRAFEIVQKSVAETNESPNIGIRDTAGSEIDGETLLRFVLTGEYTFPIDFTQTVDMNWATGGDDSLVYHTSSRGSFTLNFVSGEAVANNPSLKYYRAHGACMIIAWIGLAPLGLLIARNKYAFMGISQGAWFQLHRGMQVLALLFMICGLIIALAEFNDPEATEGKRHRKVGIAIVVIGLVQGLMGALRPHHDHSFRYLFNYAHWWLGRGAVVLGIATVFLGIKAFDNLNTDDVDKWWITCVVILGVYFAFGTVGELAISSKRSEDEKMKHEKKELPQAPPTVAP